MSFGIVLIILAAALLHAMWNTVVKTATDRTVTLGLVALGHVIPGALMVAVLPLPDFASLPYLAGSTVVHFGYFYMLNQAYRHGDLSVVYPIARGIVPALVALWAVIFAGEHLPMQAWLGIAVIATGIQVSSWSVLRQGVGRASLVFAVGTGCCISVYSLVDGLGVRVSGNILSYWAWHSVLHIFLVGFVALRRGSRILTLPLRTWAIGLIGGVVSMTAYGLVLYAKNFAPLGVVSALRETSVIFAALIGYLFLSEGNPVRRILAAVLMAAGVTMIALSS